jgi:formate dehydrogenase subunit beta
MITKLTIENGDIQGTLQAFFSQLLSAGLVDLLYIPMRTPSGTVTPALVSNPAMLAHADVLAPVMPSNGATQVGKLSIREPRPRVGVVLRSCEMRALVELVKLKQASLDDLVLISVDCAGTVDVPGFQELQNENTVLYQKVFQAAVKTPGEPLADLRLACQICEQPAYDQADIVIRLLGSDLETAITVMVKDDIAEQLSLQPAEADQRDSVLEKLVAARTVQRDQSFEQIREQMNGEQDLSSVFAACIRCHNCMNVCPICYCKTCVFKSEVFDHEPMQYVTWVKQKGAYRMPADTMLFHLTRLNHMVLSCIGCGMCTQACPADLPVGQVFRAIGQRVQEKFGYLPGRSLDEPLPLITFKADEWEEVGEA